VAIVIKWCGIDFGQCLMDPSGLRNRLVIGDICKELGEPELINERIRRYHALKEKYGSYSIIKEAHKDEILTYVFDNNQEAMELFSAKEQEFLKPAPGVEEALVYLNQQGITVCVVSELKKTLGPVGTDVVTRFLQTQNLMRYFSRVLTPQGAINLRDGSVDLSYKGLSKEAGTMYDRIAEDLLYQVIKPSEALIIGDKILTDIDPPRKRGFRTIQYTGYINFGASEADYTISNFSQLKEIVQGETDV